MARFEGGQDLKREDMAIALFLEQLPKHIDIKNPKTFKLGHNELDFILFADDDVKMVVEIKGVLGLKIEEEHTPVVSNQKVAKMVEYVNKERYDAAYIVFAYEDGIKFEEVRKLQGYFNWGGRISRDGSTNDQEIMLRFTSTDFKTAKY